MSRIDKTGNSSHISPTSRRTQKNNTRGKRTENTEETNRTEKLISPEDAKNKLMNAIKNDLNSIITDDDNISEKTLDFILHHSLQENFYKDIKCSKDWPRLLDSLKTELLNQPRISEALDKILGKYVTKE